MKSKIVFLATISFVMCATLNVFATDSCGVPDGDIDVPSGNIANKSANHWVTPIGADSTWSAINLNDDDWDTATCQCKDDVIPNPSGIKWVSTYLTNANMLGTSKTLTADNATHTGVGVYLQLDDAGNYINDGGFTQVASQTVDIVKPDKETSAIVEPSSCSAYDPDYPYGDSNLWKGTVAYGAYGLDFSHCQVTENGWNGFTTNGCNLAPPQVGDGTVWLDIDGSNTWEADNVSTCRCVNTYFPSGCTSVESTRWYIRVSGTGYSELYHEPTYTATVPSGGYFADMTVTRSSL